jgi:hypothetical protein
MGVLTPLFVRVSVVALCSAAALHAADARADVDRGAADAAARDVLRDPGFQKDLPAGTAGSAHERQASRRSSTRSADLSTPAPLAPVARLFLYSLLGVGAALAVLWAVRAARRPNLDVALGRSDPEAARAPGEQRIPVAHAQALADAGRYAEAVHTLLASVLGHLARQRHFRLDDAMTSREVLRAAELDEAPRGALEDLVMAVEVSLFGGLPPSRDDFERCMVSYRRLEEALGT